MRRKEHMTRVHKTIIIAVIFTLFLVVTCTGILVHKLHEIDTYKNDILRVLGESLGRDIQYDSGAGIVGWHPGFSFSKVVIREKSSSEIFVTADVLVTRLSVLPLLFNRVVIKDLNLEKPLVYLIRHSDGTLNIQDLLEGTEGPEVQIHKLSLDNGTIVFTDRAFHGKEHIHRLNEVDFSMTDMARGSTGRFDLSALLISREGQGSLKIAGRINLSHDENFWETARINVRLEGKKIHLASYWDYYQPYVPFQKVSGQVSLETTIKGRLNDFRAEGKIQMEELRFPYPDVFRSVLSPRNVLLEYAVAMTPDEITLKKIDLSVDQFHIMGDVSVRDISSRNPRIIAHGKSNAFKLEDYSSYIPFAVIPQGTSGFIEKNIKGGVCRLDMMRLDGRLDEIAHMEKGDNHRVLSVRATILKDGVLQLAENVPLLHKIRGELVVEGKDFILKDMSGEFGTSPFKLNGKIAGYCLDGPASYPVAITVTPQLPEIVWVMGEEAGKRFIYTGSSVFKITGDGTIDRYQLDGEWDLQEASYGYADMVKKEMGKENKVNWSSQIDGKGVTVSSLRYDLAPLSLNLSGHYMWGEKREFRIAAASNTFPLEALRGHIPLLEEYQPAGQMRIAMRAEGKNLDFADLRLTGRANLQNVSLVIGEHMGKITNLSGAFRLQEGTLKIAQESNPLTFRIGASPMSVFGELTRFKDPVANLDISSSRFRMKDVGFTSDDSKQRLTQLKANISLEKDRLTMHSLSGRLGESDIHLKGYVSHFRKPEGDFQITSPFLAVEDLIALTGIRTVNKEKGHGEMGTIKAAVSVDRGTWQRIPFQDVQTHLVFDKQMLTFDSLEFSTMNGRVALKGSVDLTEETPKYKIDVKTDSISSRRLNRELGLRRILTTGPLTIRGGMTCRGKTIADLEKTAEGDIGFTVAGGSVNGFSVLSKILSILNVAQLLKMQLPDVTSDGMPYNEISGHFNVYDGILYTNDLVLKSDSINMAIVGKFDMMNETIDIIVGVQPLQTIDKIVGIVPIIGWIIAGKDRTLIMVYFSVKGPANDPVVTAIPFQSMATGVFGIFKRIFQLPVEIFTNTGDVFIGR